MGTVLAFNIDGRVKPAAQTPAGSCEIVIFPGVRIERAQGTADPDQSGGPQGGNLDGTNGRRRARKTS
jgi:hypothetical protein